MLQAIAEDIARRAGYKVCAMEVVRSDMMLEFVAIAGSPDGSERLMGQGSPLDSMQEVFDTGTRMGGWIFAVGEQFADSTREVLAEYGHRPDLTPIEAPDAWLAEDMLFTLLEGRHGDLRAVLYLDEPVSGLRPTRATVAEMERELAVALQSIIGIVEREAFGEQVRMVETTRQIIQAARTRVGGDELVEIVRTELPRGLRAERALIIREGEFDPSHLDDCVRLEAIMRRLWAGRHPLVVEGGDVWCEGEVDADEAALVCKYMDEQGPRAWVVVPFGLGEEYLGTLVLARMPGGSRWTDAEIQGARAVAGDLASAMVDARSMEQAIRLNEELRALDEYRTALIGTIAHELRNPMTVLTGHLELLEEVELDALQARSFKAMRRATARMGSMTQNLVDLMRVSDAERPAPATLIDLGVVAAETLEFVRVLADAADIELSCAIASGCRVVGDAEDLRGVVANLVGNAIKYSDEGGTVHVDVSPLDRSGKSWIAVAVSDSGIGIDSDELDQLFTPFFRSADQDARRRPGTGLGLAIVKEVVERHRGTIEVTSRSGEGSVFTVLVPAAPRR